MIEDDAVEDEEDDEDDYEDMSNECRRVEHRKCESDFCICVCHEPDEE